VTIEVDDSGWGDLIGGAVIVMRRLHTNEKYSGEIPVEAFQGDAFAEKEYLAHALRIVREGAAAMKIAQDEPIHVCTGYILSEVRRSLAHEGYTVVPVKVVGATQEYAEGQYILHLARVTGTSPEEARRIRGFDTSLDWVLRDLHKRERLVKTGWKSWGRLSGAEKKK
jgi:hypothetical protein